MLVSKKPGQTTVVIQYYSLSRFFFETDVMYSLPCNNKSCSQCSSSMCLFRENQMNEQKGQTLKINKRAGENKSKQMEQNVENL